MSQTLKAPNFLERNIAGRSSLTAAVFAGGTTLPVENSDDFANGNYIYIGTLGAEGSETKAASAVPNATSVTVAALQLAHAAGASVYKLFGNKLKLYRAANVDGTQPSDASFTALGSPIDIDFDSTDTLVEDAAGSSAYWYKLTYYNSTTLAETELALSSAVRGGEYGNYCTIQAIREKGSLTNNRYISNHVIDTHRQAAKDEIDGALVGSYTIPFSPVPARIADINARLAAGLLLLSYPSTATFAKGLVDAAREELVQIQTKASTIVVNGQPTIINDTASGFSMYPDASTANADVADGGPMFTASERY